MSSEPRFYVKKPALLRTGVAATLRSTTAEDG
jgi:hypothetical protein